MSDVMNAFKRLSINMLSQEFDETGRVTFAIRQTEVNQKLLELKALILKMSVEEAFTHEDTEGFTISAL